MAVLGETIWRERTIQAGANRIGQPFQHHFKPDHCKRGAVTIAACWETGLEERYDCSGLVIASACEARGISVDRWRRDARHIKQWLDGGWVDFEAQAQPGDVVVTRLGSLEGGITLTHAGIYLGGVKYLHADGRSANPYVSEGAIGLLSEIGVLQHERLID